MLNLNALHSPYSNTRPKAFFAARKFKMAEELMTKKSGKVYNPLWSRNINVKTALSEDYNAGINEFKMLVPWVLFLSMALINILIAVF